MPLQLSTPISVGDLNSHGLTHMRIQRFLLDLAQGNLIFTVWHGYMDGENFVPSPLKNPESYTIDGEAFVEMIGGTMGHDGVLVYDDAAAALYQWMIDNGHAVGTIV